MKDAIYLENINKYYGKKKVLHDINLSIPKGCIFGLLGPSGCGKTTTVKIIAGVLKKDSGKVVVLDEKMPNLDIMADIGYMAQSAALYKDLSAYDNLKFFGSLYKLKKDELENRINYVARLTNLQDDLNKKVVAFSGGMKQRLSLAIALIANPKVLILDEPTVGIDPVLRKSIWEELYKLADNGVSILVTTHVMDEALKCDRLAMMREGKLLAVGTPEEIQNKANTTNLEDAFIYFGKLGDNDEN
ncbi:MAG: ABC transporter ATP-binding protein [Intestinibacter sp.]|uniref:ABC transporter ATP-binding protein n=2 Tax=Intestinibacter sp. TaxID=1965304 RepID=UPI002A7F11CF|nr:ABC transporter ATP-binding protein [Intestinibacter sp.]MDY4575432.1 ABC transporter ATP-binding protein [Intestinibacter sp.]